MRVARLVRAGLKRCKRKKSAASGARRRRMRRRALAAAASRAVPFLGFDPRRDVGGGDTAREGAGRRIMTCRKVCIRNRGPCLMSEWPRKPISYEAGIYAKLWMTTSEHLKGGQHLRTHGVKCTSSAQVHGRTPKSRKVRSKAISSKRELSRS